MPNLDRQFLREAAQAVHSKLPDNYGFIVIAAPFSAADGSPGGDGRMVYLSNIQRENAVAMLKEWLLKCGAAEDWMKHIM